MAVRGRLSNLPKEAINKKDEIIRLHYVEGVKQAEIKNKLKLESVSVVAEVLRRDMIDRINSFKALDKNSMAYHEKAVEIIKFLKNERKMDYSAIAVSLDIQRDIVFKIISDETSGLRNSLSLSERNDRNEEMKRLSMEEGLSITEIGKRVGLSKQMVSRIFNDMGYKPIRGTRRVQISSKGLPELTSFIEADCNAKLEELANSLRLVKGQYASSRQYNNKVIAELRCLLVQAYADHLTLSNFREFKKQCKYVKTLYTQFTETTTPETRPPQYEILEETVRIIKNTERTKNHKEIVALFNGKEVRV